MTRILTILLLPLALTTAEAQSPPAPNLSPISISPYTNSIPLAWDAPTNIGDYSNVAYTIFIGQQSGLYNEELTTSATNIAIPISTFSLGTNFVAVAVRANNGGTNALVSDYSNEIIIVKRAQLWFSIPVPSGTNLTDKADWNTGILWGRLEDKDAARFYEGPPGFAIHKIVIWEKM